MSYGNLLSEIYLFKHMTEEELNLVSNTAKVETFANGDDIFTQDSKADALYIIKFGSVRIHQKGATGDNIEVAVLGTGSHFGEMAMVDNENRSATVTAVEKTDIIEVPYYNLIEVLASNPVMAVKLYKSLSHFLCGRLRVTTNDLSFTRERNLRHF